MLGTPHKAALPVGGHMARPEKMLAVWAAQLAIPVKTRLTILTGTRTGFRSWVQVEEVVVPALAARQLRQVRVAMVVVLAVAEEVVVLLPILKIAVLVGTVATDMCGFLRARSGDTF